MKETSGPKKPSVSIGIPVFNGEKYLREALDSILAQTYTDFELIISDNASTDNTKQICREYAATDYRIRYYRNKRNIGAPKNHNRVFARSRGRYFKWAAHDDVLAPEYLQKSVEVLDKDLSVVLCHSKTGRIDENGVVVGSYDHKMRIDSQKPHERFGDLISIMHNPCWPIFGVIRRNILELTPLIGSYRGSDGNLLAEIGLYGRIYEIPEYLFFRREHLQAYTQRYCGKKRLPMSIDDYNLLVGWLASNHHIYFTTWKNCFEFFRSVRRVPLSWSERLLCYEQIFGWFVREGWRIMGGELEMSFLHRSSVGLRFASVLQTILRRLMVPFISKGR